MQTDDTTPRYPTTRVNLLHAHGSPTGYLYRRGCRCAPCRAAKAEYSRRHCADNPEKVAETARLCYLKHREKILARRRARFERNPGLQAEYGRRYRERHPEREAARHRLRYKNDPEERLALCHRRRARKLAAPGTHTAADVQAQYVRQKGHCFWCHKKLGNAYHTDHVVPLGKDGSDGPENIVIACPHCNHKKSAIHPMDFAGILF